MPPQSDPLSQQLSESLTVLRRTIPQAAGAAALIERGAAQTPLGDHFHTLAQALDAACLSIVLCALDESNLAIVGPWLSGCELSPLPYSEDGQGVSSSPRPYSGEGPGVSSSPRPPGEGPGVRGFPAAGTIAEIDVAQHRIKLLVPPRTAAMAGDLVLQARLVSAGSLLVVTGPAGTDLPQAEAAAIVEFAAGFPAVWPVLSSNSADPVAPQAWPWLRHDCLLPPFCLHTAQPQSQPLPAWLSDRSAPLRVCLQGWGIARKLESALRMLEDRIELEVRQHDVRRKTALRRQAALADSGPAQEVREASEAVRRLLEEETARLDTDFNERFRDRALPSSPQMNRITNLLEDLSAADLREERCGNLACITLPRDYVRDCQRSLRELFQDDFQADWQLLHEWLQAAAGGVEARLARALPKPFAAPPVKSDKTTVWTALEKSLQVEFNHRSETPRHGLFDLITHGRRPVMIILMTLSMAGGAFGSSWIRERIAPLVLLIFAAGMIWTWYDFRKQRRDLLEKEVQRVREGLGGLIKRLYEQALRDWQGRANRLLRDNLKQLGLAAEEQLKSHAAAAAQAVAEERADLQERLRLIDAKARELGGLQQQVQRTSQQAAQASQVIDGMRFRIRAEMT